MYIHLATFSYLLPLCHSYLHPHSFAVFVLLDSRQLQETFCFLALSQSFPCSKQGLSFTYKIEAYTNGWLSSPTLLSSFLLVKVIHSLEAISCRVAHARRRIYIGTIQSEKVEGNLERECGRLSIQGDRPIGV